ncbi:PEP-CTERM sorting domain-containing protein [Microcoleus vaginatus DQ-U2]|uniref:PEP-CTERM sorting domain-containing protein n=1 Tax=Microcoleus vaginatus TaxID=119532 RepID=UPI0016847B85|nr:PEP-CTERM sorting domain-containing protein [Microcoleus sp. FACHB-DQ6]
MSQKQRSRLGSTIASTILSCAALSLAGVDQAQAAVLTYNFGVSNGVGDGFFKFNNSSLTGVGHEELAVSEGRFNGFTAAFAGSQLTGGKDFYNLVGATVLFFQGEFRGLQARGSDRASRETTIGSLPGELYNDYNVPDGPIDVTYYRTTDWSIYNRAGYVEIPGIGTQDSTFDGYGEMRVRDKQGRFDYRDGRSMAYGEEVSYTLVNTEPEPVPEPLTAGGTALALAGLTWLKHKKKMAA